MKTFKTSDFTKKGIEFIAKRNELGYVPYKKFKAPKEVKIEGVGTFTYKSSINNKVSGMQYSYNSDIIEGDNQSALRVKFW
tara:strand:+ start:431 stop:673 length:243 start_codon:yes stop_codon:yes gene_type:complete